LQLRHTRLMGRDTTVGVPAAHQKRRVQRCEPTRWEHSQTALSSQAPALRARWRRADVMALASLSVVHAFLFFLCNRWEGVWRQVPAIDQSLDLTTAWRFYHALSDRAFFDVASVWMHSSPVHTPLVPLGSALLMLVAGESRVVAESVLPVSTAVWIVATYASITRLYNRRTALWTTALMTSFPVALIYSRTYLFEQPLAAMFACAGWALIATNGFAAWRPSLLFAVLGGLVGLTRGGAPLFLVGPLVVILWTVRGKPDRYIRLCRALVALLLAAVLAATWYAPNLQSFAAYVYRASYANEAIFRSGEHASVALPNAAYYGRWLMLQGPGLPVLAIVSVSWLASAPWPVGRPLGVGAALAAAFAIDAVALLPTAIQHEGARYFLPLLPLVALLLVRTTMAIRRVRLRRVTGILVAIGAVHHVVALSIASYSGRSASAAAEAGFWDHTPYFVAVMSYYHSTPDRNLELNELIKTLASSGLPAQATVATLQSPDAFFSPNGLQFQAVRMGVSCCRFVWVPPLGGSDYSATARALAAMPVDVVLVREGGGWPVNQDLLAQAFPWLSEPADTLWRAVGQPLAISDGSRVRIFEAAVRRE